MIMVLLSTKKECIAGDEGSMAITLKIRDYKPTLN